MEKNISAVALPLLVLAGGFGTRLQPILGESPKALAQVCGQPFLSLQIEQWLKEGVTSFIFLLHHHADLIIKYLKSEENKLLKGCNVKYIVEPTPMGTGGAVAYAIRQLKIKGEFLLCNADTWLSSGFSKLMNGSSPAFLVVRVKDVGRYGEVIFDEYGVVIDFIEKKVHSNAGWINAGICRMNTVLFKDWDGKAFSLEAIIYPRLLSGRALKAIAINTDFIDIGVPEDYSKFCRWIESEKNTRL